MPRRLTPPSPPYLILAIRDLLAEAGWAPLLLLISLYKNSRLAGIAITFYRPDFFFWRDAAASPTRRRSIVASEGRCHIADDTRVDVADFISTAPRLAKTLRAARPGAREIFGDILGGGQAAFRALILGICTRNAW